jgi:transcriptional regulator GlxA family with amidase domain
VTTIQLKYVLQQFKYEYMVTALVLKSSLPLQCYCFKFANILSSSMMAATDSPATYRVLIPIYHNFNTLDVHAPCEVLGNAAFAFTPSGTSPFVIQIAAEDTNKPTQAYEQVSTKADLTFAAAQEAIEADEIDILLVPGAGPDALTPATENVTLLNLIKAFINRPTAHPRTLISICTGAVICGVAGAFAGKTVTTHWATLKLLGQKAPSATVVRKRWVDGGTDSQTGMHVISSGGISCGIDACLYFVSQQLPDGTEMAINIAQMMDYDWKAPHLGLQPSPSLMTLGNGLTPMSWTTNQW